MFVTTIKEDVSMDAIISDNGVCGSIFKEDVSMDAIMVCVTGGVCVAGGVRGRGGRAWQAVWQGAWRGGGHVWHARPPPPSADTTRYDQ